MSVAVVAALPLGSVMISEKHLYDRPEAWVRGVLARGHQQRMAAPGTYFDWLLEEYQNRRAEPFGEAVRRGVAAVLENRDPADREEGVVLSLALALVARAGIDDAAEVLQRRVEERSLTQTIGSYSDLHGRALEALNALGRLDLSAAWAEELERDEGYAPLVFSFLRDAPPHQVPDFVDIARAGFLRHALHSIVVELGITKGAGAGFHLLRSAARRIGRAGRGDYVQE